MRQASVGFHCPDCVAGANRGTRVARTTFGGRAHQGDPALVTKILIGANVLMYGLQQLGGKPFNERLELLSKGTEYRFSSPAIGVAQGEWYRLVTWLFLHASPTHILFNMISLWFLGPPLEAVLGRVRFVSVYFVTGIAAGATSYYFMPVNSASVGASGAIFGLLGALIIIYRRLRYDVRPIIAIAVLNLVIGFTSVPLGGFSNVDWHAHVGGLVAGLLLGVGFGYAPAAQRALVQWGSAVVILALAIAGTAVHTGQLNRANQAGGPVGYPQKPVVIHTVDNLWKERYVDN